MFNYGGAPTSNVRSSRLRGRIGGTASAEGISYPNPFFDLAHTYLPGTVKQMFQWCRFYYLTNALIATVVNKMAEYPITDIVLDTDSAGLKSKWENYFERDLYLRSALVDIGLFYMCYGNAIISLSHPFIKWLKCEKCKGEVQATKAKYTFRSCKFYLKCSHCGHDGDAEVRDQFLKTPHNTRLILWNPEDIDIRYNELTAETTYFYSLPGHVKNAIMVGKREVVDRSPQVFIDAVKKQKAVVLDPDNVYHLRRPSILTGKLNRGWGTPMIMPVLKDTFYLQLMKKSQEAVLLERMLPMNILSPGMSAPGANPYELVNLADWRNHTMGEIMKWRRDPLYMPVMPIPVQHQTIGGDGRALLLNAEMRQVADTIIAGMGCPPELIFGGLSWSGSNVSLRMLENTFLRYVSGLQRMIRYFIIRRTAAHLDWPEIDVRFKPFKMADDLQRKAYLFQMNQAKLISDTTLLQDSDFNPEEEDDLLRKEVKRRLEGVEEQQMAEARIGGKAQVEQAKWQAKAQMVMAREQQQAQQGKHGTAPGEPGEGAGEQGVSPGPVPEPGGQFQQMVQRIRALEPGAQQQVIQRIAAQNGQLAQQIQQQLNPQPQAQQGSAGKPLPEQKPPRRDAALI